MSWDKEREDGEDYDTDYWNRTTSDKMCPDEESYTGHDYVYPSLEEKGKQSKTSEETRKQEKRDKKQEER